MTTEFVKKDDLLRQLDNLTPENLAEVARFIEFLKFKPKAISTKEKTGEHVAFGIWADYPEAENPASFAKELRSKIEKRDDDAA